MINTVSKKSQRQPYYEKYSFPEELDDITTYFVKNTVFQKSWRVFYSEKHSIPEEPDKVTIKLS